VADLLVTDQTPALGSGGALRTYAIARALAAHGPLDVLYPVFGAPEPDAAFAAIPGAQYHPVRPSRGARRGLAYARARAEGVPAAFARGVSPELAAAAARLAACARRVIADGPTAAAALGGLARRRPVIYNARNLESSFRHTFAAPGMRGLERFEARVLARAAETWMVSPADVDAARALRPDARVRYVPNAVDVAQIAPVEPAPGGPALLVASFDYEPNRRGLRFLVEDVLPRVPEARLLVAGRGLTEGDHLGARLRGGRSTNGFAVGRPRSGTPPANPRVEVLGFVADLAPVYARAACAVVPLMEGGGSPLKFVEALAHGLPVVATPRAAAGLEVQPGKHFLLGDGADGFAAALREALAGRAAGIGPAGRRLAEERYSLEALVEAVAPVSFAARR
jgi:glycosyltransferase involved in cell wall biosynthesis